MTKNDLRTGMVVEDERGVIGVVLKNTAAGDGIKWYWNVEEDYPIQCWMELDDYREDLTYFRTDECNIVAVYQPFNFNDYTTMKAYDEENLIWEREDRAIEMTIPEVEEKLGYKIKIVG